MRFHVSTTNGVAALYSVSPEQEAGHVIFPLVLWVDVECSHFPVDRSLYTRLISEWVL